MPQLPVRFMIACAARTGSTMLVRTLRSHPELVVHGEVWGNGMVGLDGPLARAYEADPAAFAALEASRFDEPAATLDRFLEPHGAQAVGFKLKFDELVRPQWSGIRQLVEADAGLRIVFLHRHDLLRRYLSHQIVLRQTGVTNVPIGGDVPGVKAFEVDIEDCLRDIAETRARTREFEAAFAAHPSLQVVYEDLAADPQADCERVFDFLGVAPVVVRVATERIVRASPEALVLNYDALRAALDAAGETIAA
jgi:LPS sulfotransferase NodH